jgi:hypothetical protein
MLKAVKVATHDYKVGDWEVYGYPISRLYHYLNGRVEVHQRWAIWNPHGRYVAHARTLGDAVAWINAQPTNHPTRRRKIPMATTQYLDSVYHTNDHAFGGEFVKAEGALCPDGVRRNARPSGDGVADTFFSVPAFVYVGRTRVYGYVTIESVLGNTTVTEDDPATVKFVPYLYRKNAHLVGAKVEGEDESQEGIA